MKLRILYPTGREDGVDKFTDGPEVDGLALAMVTLTARFPGCYIASVDNFGMWIRTSMTGPILAVVKIV